MIYKYNHKNLVWIDLENPDQEEIRQIVDKFNIDPLVANELLTPTLRPSVDFHKDYIYMILHFPTSYNQEINKRYSEANEIDFIIGRNFIITTRYNSIDAVLEFSKIFEVKKILDKSNMTEHAGFVFYYMLRHLYKSMMDRLETLRDSMVEIEKKIFDGEEKEMVYEISKINRMLLNFRESTSLHHEILSSFEKAGKKFFGGDFDYYLQGILGEYYKFEGVLRSAKDYLDELHNTNNALLNTKQNEIMRILTINTVVIGPLTLFVGLFGMNTISSPLIGERADFWFIILIMIIMSFLMLTFFKWKKWL